MHHEYKHTQSMPVGVRVCRLQSSPRRREAPPLSGQLGLALRCASDRSQRVAQGQDERVRVRVRALYRTLHDEIVDHHGHKILTTPSHRLSQNASCSIDHTGEWFVAGLADGGVIPCCHRDLELGPDPIRPRDQDGVLEARGLSY